MKIRTGFVSNSSSSSFIFLLPGNFSLKKAYQIVEEKEPFLIKEHSLSEIEEIYQELLKNSEVWEAYDSEGNEISNRQRVEKIDILRWLLNDYIVYSFDGASEEGRLILLDKTQIKNILKQNWRK